MTTATVTQVTTEEWVVPTPAAQMTSIFLEEWATVASGGLQAIVTDMGVEMWAPVTIGGGGGGGGGSGHKSLLLLGVG